MKNIVRSFAVTLCAAVLLAGCGKKSDSGAQSSGDAAAPAGKSASATSAETPASGRSVEIKADDTMKFSLTEIRAKRGEALSVTLRNVGNTPKFSMGHNWVLLKKGANVDEFINEAMNAAATDYVPASKQDMVLRHTKLLGPKEVDTVTFNAPAEPGRYVFLCSFPGHYQVGMKGELVVE
ncbi:plastocyanin/azurin family copper-binding protein [Opitutus terrae]|uniref:Blue (Type 1) copper domain protein n=1 Tax=Opitutus terrae (strain DSM 11246 / JCM 15787 / PB90-1) TaxID=452637 RepID=B1ZWX5_OPITP|nr:azurin [Opitutus terrae]ACB75086.1 blue (type 1) copper domain protein [Opitutus terrae PB90-1]